MKHPAGTRTNLGTSLQRLAMSGQCVCRGEPCAVLMDTCITCIVFAFVFLLLLAVGVFVFGLCSFSRLLHLTARLVQRTTHPQTTRRSTTALVLAPVPALVRGLESPGFPLHPAWLCPRAFPSSCCIRCV